MRAGPILVLLVILSVTVLAQPPRPTDALQIGDPSGGLDIRFPVTVSQCEPVLIYANVIGQSLHFLAFYSPDDGPFHYIIRMQLPRYSIRYMEWICNIPAGYRFVVSHARQYYVNVQAGPSSCLGNIATLSLQGGGFYYTGYQSYTANPPNTTTPFFTRLATWAAFPFLAVVPKLTVRQFHCFFPHRGLLHGHSQVRAAF